MGTAPTRCTGNLSRNRRHPGAQSTREKGPSLILELNPIKSNTIARPLSSLCCSLRLFCLIILLISLIIITRARSDVSPVLAVQQDDQDNGAAREPSMVATAGSESVVERPKQAAGEVHFNQHPPPPAPSDNLPRFERHLDESQFASSKLSASKLSHTVTYVKIGLLLEESNYEQANMFIRTIKMINEQKDDTIRQLLNMFAATKRAPTTFTGPKTKAAAAAVGIEKTVGGAVRSGEPTLPATRPLGANGSRAARLRNLGDGDADAPARDTVSSGGRPTTPAQKRRSGSKSKLSGAREPSDWQQSAGLKIKSISSSGSGGLGARHRPIESGGGDAGHLEGAGGQYLGANDGGVNEDGDDDDHGAEDDDNEQGAAATETGRRRSDSIERQLLSSSLSSPLSKARRSLILAGDTAAGNKTVNYARQRPGAGQWLNGHTVADTSGLYNIKLEPVIEFLSDRESALEADEKVCQLIESGVRAIIGPLDGHSIQHVQSICDNLEIPYFELRPFIGSGTGGTGTGSLSSSPPAVFTQPLDDLAASQSTSSPVSPSHSLSVSSLAAALTGPAQVARQNQPGVPIRGQSAGSLSGNQGSQSELLPVGRIDTGDDDDDEDDDQYSASVDSLDGGEAQSTTKTTKRRHVLESRRTSSSSNNGNTNSNNNNSNRPEDLTLNLFPPSHLLNSAYIDLIYALNWTSFAIVYESSDSMIRLQNLFREASAAGSWANKWRIRLFRHDPRADQLERHEPTSGGGGGGGLFGSNQDDARRSKLTVRLVAGAEDSTVSATQAAAERRNQEPYQRDNSSSLLPTVSAASSQQQQGHEANKNGGTGGNSGMMGTYRDVFWRVKLSGEHNILLDVKTENLYEALKQAQQVGCMTEEFSYLVTSLDLHMIDLEDFKYSRTKITSLSLIQVAKLQQSVLRQQHHESSSPPGGAQSEPLGDESAAGGRTRPLSNRPHFDEEYLENLGVHSIHQGQATSDINDATVAQTDGKRLQAVGAPLLNAAAAISINGTGYDSYSSYASEAESNDQARREQLQSSPASLGLLPTVDRNNEQRLFDFFLQQQERNMSRVRMSTSSAILHDSLLLYMLSLNELDPSGGRFLDSDYATSGGSGPDGGETTGSSRQQRQRVRQSRPQSQQQQQSIFCGVDSAPWSHGSSLVNYMKQATFSGLTGRISFDQRGLRSDFQLDIMGMAANIRLVKIGEWHSRLALDEATRTQLPRSSGRFAQQPLAGQSATGSDGAAADSTARQSAAKVAGGSADQDELGQLEQEQLELLEEPKSYDELADRYERELSRSIELLAKGQQVHVPYTKRVSPSGALLVNEIIFEHLYREQADKIDTLIVTSKLSQPYFMLKETPNKLDGNDQYEGYAVDLIHELSKLVNFRYKWREVSDKKYGSKEVLANGSIVWNGMIGEIVRGEADLAIVDLTITAQREEAVDFTLPFMNTGISILFKKPTTKVTTLFSFLSPFSSDVWAYVLAAYCGISAILFLVGHLSPYEWADPHPCGHLNSDSDTAVLKNQFSLLNSFWFTIGSLMQQGSDLTPRSMSTRTIAGIWYFFTLIMISSYTANLAAFLTVEKVVYPIENVRDLSNQQEIKYGCVESGSTCLFFHDSQIDTYKKIDEMMRRHRTYVRSNDEGQKRVGEGKFAFFMESTTIEYIIERNCNLTQIGGLIDSKGYGLATSKKPRHKRPYRTLLNEGILHLQETGMLHVLKNRWWKEKRGGGTCNDDGKSGGVTELSLANVGGVFVVLLGGLGLSFLVAIAEFIWRARRSGSTRDRMCEEMMNDLKFALACKSSTKPIHKTGNGNNFKRITNKVISNAHISDATSAALARARQEALGANYFYRNPNVQANGGFWPTQALLAANGSGGGGQVRKNLANHRNETIDASNGHNQRQHYQRHALGQIRRSGHNVDINEADFALPRATSNKDCDPILLHAMLTMLSQQQPDHFQASNQHQHSDMQLDAQIPHGARLVPSKRTVSQLYLADEDAPLGHQYVHGSGQQMGTTSANAASRTITSHGPMEVAGGFMHHSATVDENLNRYLMMNRRQGGDDAGDPYECSDSDEDLHNGLNLLSNQNQAGKSYIVDSNVVVGDVHDDEDIGAGDGADLRVVRDQQFNRLDYQRRLANKTSQLEKNRRRLLQSQQTIDTD